MKRQLFLAAVILATSAATATALENQWGSGPRASGGRYADYTIDRKTITLYCSDGAHEFVFDMPARVLDPSYAKLKEVDLIMSIDARAPETKYDDVRFARARVDIVADMIQFRLYDYDAWLFQVGLSFAEYVTVAIAANYDPASPKLEGVFTVRANTPETEYAVLSVLTPCADDPTSPYDPPKQ